ncbi:MAG: hemerythrin domain-containing protein [Bdellovibrionota bacterium]
MEPQAFHLVTLLRKQHDYLLTQLAAFAIGIPSREDIKEFWTLLLSHTALEERHFHPALAKVPEASRPAPKGFESTGKKLLLSVKAFAARWSDEAPQGDHAAFLSELQEVSSGLGLRILEEEKLFPLILNEAERAQYRFLEQEQQALRTFMSEFTEKLADSSPKSGKKIRLVVNGEGG